MSLVELLGPSRRVAVVGLAKNTGKTETLGAILRELEQLGRTVGVTSVGRDGEARDAIDARIEKPRVRLAAGSLVATTDALLRASALRYELVEETGIRTPLGRVAIVRLLQGGAIEVAGPSAAQDVRAVADAMLARGAEQVLVDGAIDRRAASSPAVCDGLVMCTGAVLHEEIERVVAITRDAVDLVRLPVVEDAGVRALAAGGEAGAWGGAGEWGRASESGEVGEWGASGEGGGPAERSGAALLGGGASLLVDSARVGGRGEGAARGEGVARGANGARGESAVRGEGMGRREGVGSSVPGITRLPERFALASSAQEISRALLANPEADHLILRGALHEPFLRELLSAARGRPLQVVVRDSTKVFLSERGRAWYERQGVSLRVLAPTGLRVLTVNPLAPRSHSFPSGRLRGMLAGAVRGVAVVDVREGRRAGGE